MSISESFICFRKVWFDIDVIELNILVSDGKSQFSINVYTGHQYLENVVEQLESFKYKVHGGIFDMKFGEFGPEFANGGFIARLHFQKRGKLNISVHMESEHREFSNTKVASLARLYLQSEAALLDAFTSELRAVSESNSDVALLECLGS